MVSVTTQHYDNARNGWNKNETTLTVTNVAGLHKLFDLPVDGQVYAQPLYMEQITFPGKGVRNALYVATENDSVYCWDADAVQTLLWHKSLLPAGEIPVDDGDIAGCNNISPRVGITGTPAIDPRGGTIYVVSKTKRQGRGQTSFHHYLHALDLVSGDDRPGSPVEIFASALGWGGTGEVGGRDGHGNVIFLTQWALNRPGLLLQENILYLGFGSHCDAHLGDYHGWVMSYDATTLRQLKVFCTSPNSSGGGVWQGGIGPAGDGRAVYFTTGNAQPVGFKFGNLQDGQHESWIADFTGAGQAQVLFYYEGDGNWWLGTLAGGITEWSLVSQSAGFGNLLDGQHPIWIGDFTGAGHAQVLFYYKGDGHWWLGNMAAGQLQWSLVSQSAGFGNLLDGDHPIWIGDFTGAGHLQVLFYYNGDGHWWLGSVAGGQLQWSLVSKSGSFGNLLDGQHPIWIGDFSGAGQLQVLFYYKGDGHWWLGNMAGGQLHWSLVSQSAGFGNLLDGQHPIWIGDFAGVGHPQVMFYNSGDGHWWLGTMAGGQLQWSLVATTAFGGLLDGRHPVWLADFTGAGHAQILFYYQGDGHWWLGDMAGGQLHWSLVSQSAGFGNLLDGNHPIWIGDFTDVGHAQVLFYYSGDGHWWLGDMAAGQLHWSLVSQSAGFGNLLDGQHPIWIGNFSGGRQTQVMFYYSGDGHWWLGSMVHGQLQWSLAVPQNLGNTALKLTPELALASWFTPADQEIANANDWDFGSGGVLLLPDTRPGTPHANLLVTCGKDGDIFLLDRTNLGGFSGPGGNNPNAVATVPLQPGVPKNKQPGVWGGPAYYQGPGGEFVFYCGNGGKLTAFAVSRPAGTLTPTTRSPDKLPAEGGATPVVSSNGLQAGTAIVWAIARRDGHGKLHLQAYDASDVSWKLVDLECGAWANANGGAFIEPTVVNGRVYVGSDDRVTVFGL